MLKPHTFLKGGHKALAKFDMERAFTVLMKNLSRSKTSKIKK